MGWIRKLKLEYTLVPLLSTLCWSIWNCRNFVILNNVGVQIFGGYLHGYARDPTMIFSTPGGSTGTSGYWMVALGYQQMG